MRNHQNNNHNHNNNNNSLARSTTGPRKQLEIQKKTINENKIIVA